MNANLKHEHQLKTPQTRQHQNSRNTNTFQNTEPDTNISTTPDQNLEYQPNLTYPQISKPEPKNINKNN